jgi:uncharacterized protein (UPF0332 family)
MKEVTEKTLLKASRALRAMEVFLREGDADFAVRGAYDAMFFTAEALRKETGLRSQQHNGGYAGFGEPFVRSGLLESKFHRWLLDAFDKRVMSH